MTRTMFAGKIHRATVTEVDVDYEGSITVDPSLLEASGILPYEKVQVPDEEASEMKPKIVRVGAKNHIASEQSPLLAYADR